MAMSMVSLTKWHRMAVSGGDRSACVCVCACVCVWGGGGGIRKRSRSRELVENREPSNYI